MAFPFMAVAGLGLSLYQMGQQRDAANQSALEAQKNMQNAMEAAQEQSTIDALQRKATANSILADVRSRDAQVEQLQRASDIMGMQGKADSVMRAEEYNKLASAQMVMGAASGRVMDDYGSFGKIVNKSYDDYQWDQMWNENAVTINQAALYQDMQNIREGQVTSLLLGQESLNIAAESSALNLRNAARTGQIQQSNAQSAIDASNRASMNTFINNVGGSAVGIFNGLNLGSSTPTLSESTRMSNLIQGW